MAMARPQLRGLLQSTFKRNLIIASIVSATCTVAWKYSVTEPRKNRYSEFYKHYDAKKDFERMKAAGVFHSVTPDGSIGQMS